MPLLTSISNVRALAEESIRGPDWMDSPDYDGGHNLTPEEFEYLRRDERPLAIVNQASYGALETIWTISLESQSLSHSSSTG